MPITSILVYVDTTPASDDRVELAARLAQRCDAYLSGAGLEEAALGPRERFERRLRQDQLQGEWQTIIGLATSYVARHAAAHDLVVIGQRNPDVSTGLDAPADVVLGCGRPVLVIPYAGSNQKLDGHALIAWNGSREAKRAVQDALPLMALCDQVTVLCVNPEEDADIELEGELVTHLARHGLTALAESTTAMSAFVADAVLTRANQLNANIVVMGAYGHSRLRETILGGTTHDMLRDMTRPVLMSH
jgi:nucleotide-binding universal stress UspA family protein